MRVALLQFAASQDKAENLATIRELARRAAPSEPDLVVCPEASMYDFGAADAPLAPAAEPVDGPFVSALADLAGELGAVVVAGMFETAGDADRAYNTVVAVTPDGTLAGAYRKIHLYDAFGFQESRTVAPGSELVSVDVEGVQIGLATCYDIRFPELFQAHGEAGAAAVVVPASWGAGEGKREQWELLVRARALDSGCWILACGQADPTASGIETKPGVPTGIGYSTVADPFGNVHDQLGAGPGILVVDIDPKRAEESRQATAVLANRRL